ncbi:CLK4-associating serine/arginine rich protein [Varanus komodoensis]|nr:CLK4-associating serine/arginine rich protein [Varanus komodoensis]
MRQSGRSSQAELACSTHEGDVRSFPQASSSGGPCQQHCHNGTMHKPRGTRLGEADLSCCGAAGERHRAAALSQEQVSHSAPSTMKCTESQMAAGRTGEMFPPKLTPQEKLKLRMQKALNRQFKADKKAAQEKMMQQEHERQEREDELRAMARKIRMKERERREKEREEWERQYSRQSRSPSPRYSREYSSSRRHSRSRSRSPHYRH